MATPGYDGQVIGRDCDCEDFPCCGHGITAADVLTEAEYCDRCGFAHFGNCDRPGDDEEYEGIIDEDEEFL